MVTVEECRASMVALEAACIAYSNPGPLRDAETQLLSFISTVGIEETSVYVLEHSLREDARFYAATAILTQVQARPEAFAPTARFWMQRLLACSYEGMGKFWARKLNLALAELIKTNFSNEPGLLSEFATTEFPEDTSYRWRTLSLDLCVAICDVFTDHKEGTPFHALLQCRSCFTAVVAEKLLAHAAREVRVGLTARGTCQNHEVALVASIEALILNGCELIERVLSYNFCRTVAGTVAELVDPDHTPQTTDLSPIFFPRPIEDIVCTRSFVCLLAEALAVYKFVAETPDGLSKDSAVYKIAMSARRSLLELCCARYDQSKEHIAVAMAAAAAKANAIAAAREQRRLRLAAGQPVDDDDEAEAMEKDPPEMHAVSTTGTLSPAITGFHSSVLQVLHRFVSRVLSDKCTLSLVLVCEMVKRVKLHFADRMDVFGNDIMRGAIVAMAKYTTQFMSNAATDFNESRYVSARNLISLWASLAGDEDITSCRNSELASTYRTAASQIVSFFIGNKLTDNGGANSMGMIFPANWAPHCRPWDEYDKILIDIGWIARVTSEMTASMLISSFRRVWATPELIQARWNAACWLILIAGYFLADEAESDGAYMPMLLGSEPSIPLCTLMREMLTGLLSVLAMRDKPLIFTECIAWTFSRVLPLYSERIGFASIDLARLLELCMVPMHASVFEIMFANVPFNSRYYLQHVAGPLIGWLTNQIMSSSCLSADFLAYALRIDADAVLAVVADPIRSLIQQFPSDLTDLYCLLEYFDGMARGIRKKNLHQILSVLYSILDFLGYYFNEIEASRVTQRLTPTSPSVLTCLLKTVATLHHIVDEEMLIFGGDDFRVQIEALCEKYVRAACKHVLWHYTPRQEPPSVYEESDRQEASAVLAACMRLTAEFMDTNVGDRLVEILVTQTWRLGRDATALVSYDEAASWTLIARALLRQAKDFPKSSPSRWMTSEEILIAVAQIAGLLGDPCRLQGVPSLDMLEPALRGVQQLVSRDGPTSRALLVTVGKMLCFGVMPPKCMVILADTMRAVLLRREDCPVVEYVRTQVSARDWTNNLWFDAALAVAPEEFVYHFAQRVAALRRVL